MGVSFEWKPVDPTAGTSFGHGSTLHSYLEKAFGCFPIVLNPEDIPKLQGIIACGHDDLEDLIMAIGEHEKIKITAHW